MKNKSEFTTLIERLEMVAKIIHPERIWDDNIREYISFEWIGKETELKARVERLETEAAKLSK